MKMNQQVADGIRASILEVCKDDSKSMTDILGDERLSPFINRYGIEEVRKTVYALVGCGALFSGGKAQSSRYIITSNGKQFKTVYEGSFEQIREEWENISD
jgi:hypothetical protein